MRKRNLWVIGALMLSLTACSGGSSTEETTTAGIVSGDNSVVKAETEVVTQEETSGEDTTEAATEEATTVAEASKDVVYSTTHSSTDKHTNKKTTVTVDLLSSTLHGFDMKDGGSTVYESVNAEGELSYISIYVLVKDLRPADAVENEAGYFVRYNMDGGSYYGHILDDGENPNYDIQVIFHDVNDEFGGDATRMADIIDELIANMNITVEVTDVE